MKKYLCLLFIPFILYAKDITVAVIAISGLEQAKKEWMPTLNYLQKNLADHTFKLLPIEPRNLNKLKELIHREKIDFIITQPAIYIELELELGVSRILTLIKSGGLAEFGSVLISTKEKNIHTIEDIRDKKISAVAPLGFGGWLIAYSELLEKRVDPLKDGLVSFEGTQLKVVKAIIAGKSDVGVIRSGLLEKMETKGLKGLEKLKVLNPQKANNFPYALSTKLYPEWAFAKSKHISNSIAKEVAQTLLRIDKNTKAAIAASYEAWSFPYNYQSVHDLMKRLHIGAYKNYGKMSAVEIFYEYKYLFIGFLSLLIFLISFLFYSRIMNTKLYREREEKNDLLSQLETIFNLQVSLLLVINKDHIFKANHAFLQFFDLLLLEDFSRDTATLEQCFDYVDDKNFISLKQYGKEWIELVSKCRKSDHYKVKMGRHIFSIHVKALPYDAECFIIMLNDITYIEDNEAFLESQIEISKQEVVEKQQALFAQSKQAAMGEMIGVIAHQLKQPLSTMSAINNKILLDIMMEALDVNDLKKSLERETLSIELMTETIDDFRTFFSPHKKEKIFLLNHCIKSVLTLLTPVLQREKIIIQYQEDKNISLMSLENELFHVLMNIISNAKDALVFNKIKNPKIIITTYTNGEKITIMIEDNAGGIDADIIDKIFTQYFTTKEESGTGIGLHLSKMIIEESLGGVLSVCNTQEGAQFSIVI